MVKVADFAENPYTTAYVLNKTNVAIEQKRGKRMGMSTLGEKCTRKMWFKFRWGLAVAPLNKRIKRIFDAGHFFEELVVESLTEIGIQITRQQEEVPGFAGHIVGFIDGVALGVLEAPKTEHLLEVKSMNDKHFQAVKKKGVKLSKPEHYSQTQNYMGKLQLTRTLYAAINKNDCEIYIERIHFDESFYRENMGRAVDVVSSEVPPPNVIADPANYTCRYCDFHQLCYDGVSMLKSCRTCKFVSIENDGGWSCDTLQKSLTYEEQLKGCNHYKVL